MLSKNIVEKGEIAQNERFHLFPQCFLYAICILESFNSHISVVICSFFEFEAVSKWCIMELVKNFLKATFQLSFTASLNLVQSQNGALGNG